MCDKFESTHKIAKFDIIKTINTKKWNSNSERCKTSTSDRISVLGHLGLLVMKIGS